MANHIHVQSFSLHSEIEIAERKGTGHPDSICDSIAEEVSVALSKYYFDEFGRILPFNVDKALLVGGKSLASYKGGKITEPMKLYIVGRATTEVGGKKVPVEDIAISATKKWFSSNLRFLDTEKHLVIIPEIRKGNADLFRQFQGFDSGGIPIAADTFFGVGFYPFTFLEEKVLEMGKLLNSRHTKELFPFLGEDIKVMGVQSLVSLQFTVAISMIDKFINNIEEYKSRISEVKGYIKAELGLYHAIVNINSADDYNAEDILLTVTGTGAENGIDGQAGRGNRMNGIITPYRPMSLETYSGKKMLFNVSKIYNHFAMELSKSLSTYGFAEEANVFIVSQAGEPITQPQLLDIRVKNQSADDQQIQAFVKDKLYDMPALWNKIMNHDKLSEAVYIN